MIKVTLGDVFHNHERGESWLVLADEAGKNGLAIFIGSWDVKFITLGLRKRNPRPLTFNFFASVLEAIGADLVEAQIVGRVNNTFTAVACIRSGGVEKRVDARPSDAVALAAVMGRPIYVREEVMAAAGTRLGADGRPPDLAEGFVSTRSFWAEGPEAGASGPDREAKEEMKQAGNVRMSGTEMNRDAKERLFESLKAGDGLEWMRQLSALREANPREALDAVIQLMHSPDQAVRRRAGSSLSWFGEFVGTRAAELADMLQRHEDERVRLSCAIHLMPVHGAGVDQAYLAALRDPAEKVVQIACVEVGARAGAQAVEALAGVLEHTSWRVRLEACKALITLNKADARVVSALERMSREPEAAVYDRECEGQGFKVEELLEFGEALGILRESEKDEITAELQREGWGTVHSILARARRIAGDLQ